MTSYKHMEALSCAMPEKVRRCAGGGQNPTGSTFGGWQCRGLLTRSEGVLPGVPTPSLYEPTPPWLVSCPSQHRVCSWSGSAGCEGWGLSGARRSGAALASRGNRAGVGAFGRPRLSGTFTLSGGRRHSRKARNA